jgi:hypothetical protein
LYFRAGPGQVRSEHAAIVYFPVSYRRLAEDKPDPHAGTQDAQNWLICAPRGIDA